MDGSILIITGLVLDCAGALMITTPLLTIVRELEAEIGPVERLNQDGSLTVAQTPTRKGHVTILDRFLSGKDAVKEDSKKQNSAKGGIILLVIGFLAQIVGNILS